MLPSNEILNEQIDLGYPADWDENTLHKNWINYLINLIKETKSSVPLKRIQFQVEQSTEYQEIVNRWPRMNASERLKAWKKLLESSDQTALEVLPTCVQCGECCRRGSPTLHLEDLDLLRQGKIPWEQLLTIRRSEPVKSAFEEKPFFLLDERIKIREKEGTQECVFLDASACDCGIYADRPLQCRAQACWDETQAKELAKQSYLTRRDIFEGVELLLGFITEHDRRCSFEKLNQAFQNLAENQGKTIDEVLELLAYEEHFRQFLSEKLNIPESNLELVFGRSFSNLVPLFGFRVIEEPDGSKCLVLDEQ
jgi:Fe-S-cluster containining protein